MDPNPKSFPILSFVMSRLHPSPPKLGGPDPLEPDLEQPPIDRPIAGGGRNEEVELMERMPHLNHPGLIASMATAVSNVTQTRTVLQTLGDSPDHEAVDNARIKIVEIDSALSRQLEEIVRAPRPDEVDLRHWRAEQAEREKECRAKAEREKIAYKAVIQLDEMHEAYERLLRDAEERLEKMYNSAESGGGPVMEEDEHVNEEVIGILQEASAKCVERVELSGRQLRFLPEAFGRMHGLVSLNVSNNQLEVCVD